MNELHELKERLVDELKDYGKRDITSGSLDMIDKLAHATKNLDKIIQEDGYSGRYHDDWGRSYARKRDAMGRYSRAGMADKLRELMADAPDEKSREEIRRLADKMEM